MYDFLIQHFTTSMRTDELCVDKTVKRTTVLQRFILHNIRLICILAKHSNAYLKAYITAKFVLFYKLI